MTHGNAPLQQLGISGFTFGQNGGYNGNCTTDFSGPEELDLYWYHPDHLGSSSFITGIDGEVNQNIEYFPSGETFVENHLNSYNTPYKFNSKELDDETGYYYYGARYYNPRVSLWLNVDPSFEKYPSWSPYAYSFNSPVKFIDPDGMDPIITITNQVVGWGHIKLINADNRGGKGSYVTIGVPLYKVIITDDQDSNFKMETMMSRDSWQVSEIKGKIATIKNGAFEPANADNNEYIGVYNAPYPHDNDTAGYALTQNGNDILASDLRVNQNGDLVETAKSIMIHVGGNYKNEKDPTYDDKARIRAGGSLGCFGIFNEGNSLSNPSDKETKRVIGGVRKQSDKDSWFGHSKVKIIIQKRENVERTKKVILPNQNP